MQNKYQWFCTYGRKGQNGLKTTVIVAICNKTQAILDIVSGYNLDILALNETCM